MCWPLDTYKYDKFNKGENTYCSCSPQVQGDALHFYHRNTVLFCNNESCNKPNNQNERNRVTK